MSSIGSIGSNNAMMMQGMRGARRQDPAQMAENLFSKLDTSGQGYIQKSDLQAAFDKIGTTSSTSSSTAGTSVDDLFSTLDSDGDGKVTKQEFSDSVQKLGQQLADQAMGSRMGGMGGMGGMPPPPPPQDGDDSGFTKDELSSQLSEIGSTDSKRSSLISNIVSNFDKADTDGNGKVSFKEAMAYDKQSSASSAGTASESTSTSTTASSDSEMKLMAQIMRLMQAYQMGGHGTDNTLSSTLSVSA